MTCATRLVKGSIPVLGAIWPITRRRSMSQRRTWLARSRIGGRPASRVGGSAFQSLAGRDEPGLHGGDVRGAQAALGLVLQLPDGGLGRVEPLPPGRAEGDLPDPAVCRVRVSLGETGA